MGTCPNAACSSEDVEGEGWGTGDQHLRLPAWFVVMLTTAARRGSGLRSDTPLTASIQKE